MSVIQLGGKTLPELFRNAAASKATNILLADDNGERSGHDVLQMIDQLAAGLASIGITAGERVAFLCGSSVRQTLLYVACQEAGGTVCAMHTRDSTDGVRRTLRWLRPSLIVVDDCHRQALAFSLDGYDDDPQVVVLDGAGASPNDLRFDDLCERRPGTREIPPLAQDSLAVIVLSSGTTGDPKGVMHTQATLTCGALAGSEAFGAVTTQDSVLVTMPPSFAAWSHVVLPFIASGAKVVFCHTFTPERYVRMLVEHRITCAALVPTAWRRVAAEVRRQRVLFADLRMVFYAGEPSSAQFVEEMRAAFPRAELRTAYLTSEGGGAAACASGGADLLENPGSAGKPISTAAVRVIDESREDLVDREKGFVGEIALRAGSMSVGYWGAAALTDARFVGGWWRSGDLGFVDERGMLTIVGRSDNVINSGGLKVHAEEVEAALMRHPQVRLAAVVGTPDETWGQRIEAFVVVDGTTTGDAILDFCRDQGRLAAYKIPKMIHLRDSLPTGATGKVYRRGLVLRGTELGVG